MVREKRLKSPLQMKGLFVKISKDNQQDKKIETSKKCEGEKEETEKLEGKVCGVQKLSCTPDSLNIVTILLPHQLDVTAPHAVRDRRHQQP